MPLKTNASAIFLSDIDPRKNSRNQIYKEKKEQRLENIKGLLLHLSLFRPIEAIITSDWVSTKEINPSLLWSRKLIEGLYFAGEVIDVDALTGRI